MEQEARSLVIAKSGEVRVGQVVQIDRDKYGKILLIERDRLICESFPPGQFFQVERDRRFSPPENPNEPHNGLALWNISGVVMDPITDGANVYSGNGSADSRDGLIKQVLTSDDDEVPAAVLGRILGWDEATIKQHLSVTEVDEGVEWTTAVRFIYAYVPYSSISTILDFVGGVNRLNPRLGPATLHLTVPKCVVEYLEAQVEKDTKPNPRRTREDVLADILWMLCLDDEAIPPVEADWPRAELMGTT